MEEGDFITDFNGLNVVARCKTCKNLKIAKGRAFCMKMHADYDKTLPRDITRHVSDKLFAARCGKYEAIVKTVKADKKLITIRVQR